MSGFSHSVFSALCRADDTNPKWPYDGSQFIVGDPYEIDPQWYDTYWSFFVDMDLVRPSEANGRLVDSSILILRPSVTGQDVVVLSPNFVGEGPVSFEMEVTFDDPDIGRSEWAEVIFSYGSESGYIYESEPWTERSVPTYSNRPWSVTARGLVTVKLRNLVTPEHDPPVIPPV